MPRFVPDYTPLEEAIKPRDGEVVTDRWWSYMPGKGLIFAKFGRHDRIPQCNKNKAIAEQLTKELYPDATVIHVDAVYLGHIRND